MAAPTVIVGAAVAAAVAIPDAGQAAGGERAGERGKRPNIIQIVLDDATSEMLGRETTPRIWRQLIRRGTSFEQAITTSPLCCPSRATLMTGQYVHNNGVWRTEPGYPELVDPANVLEVWLRRAGYRTAHVGKVINGMPEYYPRSKPPGWSEWYATRSHRYYRTRWWLNGRERRFSGSARNHLTRMINRRSLGVVRRAIGAKRPFFLNVAHLAPHLSRRENEGERCRRHAQPVGPLNVPFESVSPPRGPAFDEADVSDKPPMVAAWPRIGRFEELRILTEYRCAVAALAAVDRGIGKLIGELRRGGELGRTAIVLVSDNGYSWGQHRIAHMKYFPYDENLRVPLVIRLPQPLRESGVLRSPARVALIDVAPTILELARARPCRSPRRCRTMDGRSLVAAARGRVEDWHAGRALGVELGRGDWLGSRWPCRYSGVRTPEGTYVRHTRLPDAAGRCRRASFVEAYDAGADPFQLVNLAAGGAESRLEGELEDLHARISVCSGIAGRDEPSGDGRPYCE